MQIFEITSGKIRVTDPCYTRNSNPNNVLENCVSGTWVARLTTSDQGEWGIRTAELEIRHQDYQAFDADTLTPVDVSVDSGQAGFFDDDLYPDGPRVYNDRESFYGKICNGTVGTGKLANIEFGVASATGFGDGSYECYIGTNDIGQIVSAKIVFIKEDDDDDQ